MHLVLASSSPYRQELLARFHVPFESKSPAINEDPMSDETPETLALRLSAAKAQALSMGYPKHLIIGSDQVASHKGHFVTKPGSHHKAKAQLLAFSGSSLNFYTGLSVLNTENGQSITETVTSQVHFRVLTEQDIDTYLLAEKPYDCAGSFKAEGLGITLFDAITSDDPSAIIGLPLIRLRQILEQFNYRVLEHIHLEGTHIER